jgi:homospermidine synthase
MTETLQRKLASFDGRLLMVGFGGIGQGVLPLLLRHVEMDPGRIRILDPDNGGATEAAEYGIAFECLSIVRENYRQVLSARLGPGDMLVNLSVNVGSVDLLHWCQANGVIYLDACIEPWAGGYYDTSVSPAMRTNYALREQALALRRGKGHAPTGVLTHGVNPGLVSHFVKQALLDLGQEVLGGVEPPEDRSGWATLAQRLGVKVIHIAERDTQTSLKHKARGEFVNTWSVDGFAGEGCQPAELGWGTHERHWPQDAHRHDHGCDSAIWLERPGAGTRVRSWTPLEGPYLGYLITHGESISIADYLTVQENGLAVYRPTVHYAYHPCNDAVLSLHELAGRGFKLQPIHRQLRAQDIDGGIDELGVLLLGHARGAYWYGSRLTNDQAMALVPHNNATSLQTCAGVLGGTIWAMNHPHSGIVDPEEIDWHEVMDAALPYLGEMVGVYSDWTPLDGRGRLFPEDLDAEDPWQFKNILVP